MGDDGFFLLADGLVAAAGVTAAALEDMICFVVLTAAMMAIVANSVLW